MLNTYQFIISSALRASEHMFRREPQVVNCFWGPLEEAGILRKNPIINRDWERRTEPSHFLSLHFITMQDERAPHSSAPPPSKKWPYAGESALLCHLTFCPWQSSIAVEFDWKKKEELFICNRLLLTFCEKINERFFSGYLTSLSNSRGEDNTVFRV